MSRDSKTPYAYFVDVDVRRLGEDVGTGRGYGNTLPEAVAAAKEHLQHQGIPVSAKPLDERSRFNVGA